MFHFNSDKFDFWSIYESIKHFYPIGIKKDDSRMYHSYPGLKELEDRIVDNIHIDEHFNSRWENFTATIQKEIGKEIIDTTYGQAPSFSSYVLLESSSMDNLTRTKEIHFFVSLIGPYYTVIGSDNSAVKVLEGQYKGTSYLVVSPFLEYVDIFKLLCEKIEKQFIGFRFVPFEICRQTIEGLDVRYSDENLNTVFHALFNNHIGLNTLRTVGDKYYKYDDWLKEGYIDDGESWSAYPPVE
jgi:hypothetical protein